MLRHRRRHRLCLLLMFMALSSGNVQAEGWKAGTGRQTITPKSPLWMAGYGARNKPSEGEIHPLWAKALAMEEPSGQRSLIVTLDVCGIDGATSTRIRDRIARDHKIGCERVVLACSHTHCGPVLGTNLLTMYGLDEPERRRIADYTQIFETNVAEAVSTAFETLEPISIAWETGRADFAVNRRTNKEPEVPALRDRNALEGPIDHDVPVLRLKNSQGKIKAVVFGYACHCTVLSFYQFCGDYAGFAQIALEARYPEAQAMFVAGCGADQNPLPRRTIEIAGKYGEELASAASRVLESPMRSVEGNGTYAYKLIDLKLGKLPDREQIEADSNSKTIPVANRAKKLLHLLETEGKLATSYPYPVQVWKLGDLTWVFLGGEVVVDYSLRLKRNIGSSRTWVSSYCNDVMAYIPSLRVLKEGGYEGATAMIYYGLPTSWSQDVETQIIGAVTELVGVKTSP